jgi:hypothetical protein
MSNFSKIADAAKDFACGIYRTVPRNIIPVISDIQQFYWDGFCGDPPRDPLNLPPPPSKPFSGGQCSCIKYRVIFTLHEIYDGQLYTRATGISLNGEVTSYRIVKTSTDWSVQFLCRGDASSPCSPSLIWISGFDRPTERLYSLEKITFDSIRREDGGADNCGDPPSEYPLPPPVPPGGYTSLPTPIVFNDNTTHNFIFNFLPPSPPPANSNFLPPIVINYIDPKFNFKIPLTFNFDGTVNFGGGNSYNQDDRDNINNIKNVTNSTNNTVNNTSNNIDNFYGNYKKDRDRIINKKPLPDDFEPPKPPEPPGKKLVERLAYVNVDLSVIPSNAKSQSGQGAPNVVYAGWFEFLRKDKSFPRDYIHFANNCFIAPVGADGYAFTLYNGYQGSAIAITFKE